MKETTLCFPIKKNAVPQVLLGYKKVGFGQGKLTGIGGKVEKGERLPTAVTRELFEETSLITVEDDLQPAGTITFLFPHKPAWSLIVHLFLVTKWQGHPLESREIRPAWFAVDAIPYDQMWDDGRYWLPLILQGQTIIAEFSFASDNETVVAYKIARGASKS